MRVAYNSALLISGDGTMAAVPGEGRVFPLGPSDRARLEDLRDGRDEFRATDVGLLERGLISLAQTETERRRLLQERVAQHLSTRGALCVMPTERCNFRCGYCYQAFARGKMAPGVVAALESFLTQLPTDLTHYDLAWFGGEPLLALDIVVHLSSVFRHEQKRMGRKGTISVTTNGFLLDSAAIGALSSLSVDVYQITIDGPEALHNSNRHLAGGRGSYQTILSNTLCLLERSASEVILRVNFDSKSTDTTSTLADWLTKELLPSFRRFGSRVRYQIVPIWDATTTSIDGICLTNVAEFQNWMHLRRLVTPEPARLLPELVRELNCLGSLSCYAGKPHHYVIGSDGSAYKCTVALDLPSNKVGHLDSRGRLCTDSSLEAIWTRQNSLTDSTCASCALSGSCMGLHCPLLRVQTGRQPCPTTKRFIFQLLSGAGA